MNNETKEKKKTADALKIELAKQETKVISKSQSDELLNVDLDNKGLMNQLAKMTIKDSNESSNANMFRFDTLIPKYNTLKEEEKKKVTKQLRKKARKLRNMYINNILFNFKAKDNKELKQVVKSFNQFYKEYYVLNDFSIKSICRNSSDNDTLIKCTLAFQVIKNLK